MALNPGQTVIGETDTVTYEAGEALSAGDVVGINTGQLAKADGTTDTNPIGVIVGNASAAGENVSVAVAANGILANVASAISAGTELGASATEGQLGSGSDEFHALTDEGAAAGLVTNESIPTGYAVVKF